MNKETIKKESLNLMVLNGSIEASKKTKPRFWLEKFLKPIFVSEQQMTLEEWDRLESKPRRSNINRCPTFSRYF